jgi:hypothetical protein
LFYFGGDAEKWKGKYQNPAYTGELLVWFYVMLGLCISGVLIFAVTQFLGTFKKNIKSSLVSLAVLVAFALLLLLSYSLGSGEPIPGINVSSQQYNVEFWLKVSDTWIFTMGFLIGLSILAIIWGSLKKSFNK